MFLGNAKTCFVTDMKETELTSIVDSRDTSHKISHTISFYLKFNLIQVYLHHYCILIGTYTLCCQFYVLLLLVRHWWYLYYCFCYIFFIFSFFFHFLVWLCGNFFPRTSFLLNFQTKNKQVIFFVHLYEGKYLGRKADYKVRSVGCSQSNIKNHDSYFARTVSKLNCII